MSSLRIINVGTLRHTPSLSSTTAKEHRPSDASACPNYVEVCPGCFLVATVAADSNKCVIEALVSETMVASFPQFASVVENILKLYKTPKVVHVLAEDEGYIATVELVKDARFAGQQPYQFNSLHVHLFIGTTNGTLLVVNALRATVLAIAQFQHHHSEFGLSNESLTADTSASTTASSSSAAANQSTPPRRERRKRENQPITKIVVQTRKMTHGWNPNAPQSMEAGSSVVALAVFVVHDGGMVVRLSRSALEVFVTVAREKPETPRPHLILEWPESPGSLYNGGSGAGIDAAVAAAFPCVGPARRFAMHVEVVHQLATVKRFSTAEATIGAEANDAGAPLPNAAPPVSPARRNIYGAAFFSTHLDDEKLVDTLSGGATPPVDALLVCGSAPLFAIYTMESQKSSFSATQALKALGSAVKGMAKSLWCNVARRAAGEDSRSNPDAGVSGGSATAELQRLREISHPAEASIQMGDATFTAVTVDPTQQYAAFFSEGAGRVYVCDLAAGGVICWVLKGCRAAHCRWWVHTIGGKPILLLCVHQPLRSIVEVFSLRLQRRVAACNVPEGALLLSPSPCDNCIFGLLLTQQRRVDKLALEWDPTIQSPTSTSKVSYDVSDAMCVANDPKSLVLLMLREPLPSLSVSSLPDKNATPSRGGGDCAAERSVLSAEDDANCTAPLIWRLRRDIKSLRHYRKRLGYFAAELKRRYAPNRAQDCTVPCNWATLRNVDAAVTDHQRLSSMQCLNFILRRADVVEAYEGLLRLRVAAATRLSQAERHADPSASAVARPQTMRQLFVRSLGSAACGPEGQNQKPSREATQILRECWAELAGGADTTEVDPGFADGWAEMVNESPRRAHLRRSRAAHSPSSAAVTPPPSPSPSPDNTMETPASTAQPAQTGGCPPIMTSLGAGTPLMPLTSFLECFVCCQPSVRFARELLARREAEDRLFDAYTQLAQLLFSGTHVDLDAFPALMQVAARLSMTAQDVASLFLAWLVQLALSTSTRDTFARLPVERVQEILQSFSRRAFVAAVRRCSLTPQSGPNTDGSFFDVMAQSATVLMVCCLLRTDKSSAEDNCLSNVSTSHRVRASDGELRRCFQQLCAIRQWSDAVTRNPALRGLNAPPQHFRLMQLLPSETGNISRNNNNNNANSQVTLPFHAVTIEERLIACFVPFEILKETPVRRSESIHNPFRHPRYFLQLLELQDGFSSFVTHAWREGLVWPHAAYTEHIRVAQDYLDRIVSVPLGESKKQCMDPERGSRESPDAAAACERWKLLLRCSFFMLHLSTLEVCLRPLLDDTLTFWNDGSAPDVSRDLFKDRNRQKFFDETELTVYIDDMLQLTESCMQQLQDFAGGVDEAHVVVVIRSIVGGLTEDDEALLSLIPAAAMRRRLRILLENMGVYPRVPVYRLLDVHSVLQLIRHFVSKQGGACVSLPNMRIPWFRMFGAPHSLLRFLPPAASCVDDGNSSVVVGSSYPAPSSPEEWLPSADGTAQRCRFLRDVFEQLVEVPHKEQDGVDVTDASVQASITGSAGAQTFQLLGSALRIGTMCDGELIGTFLFDVAAKYMWPSTRVQAAFDALHGKHAAAAVFASQNLRAYLGACFVYYDMAKRRLAAQRDERGYTAMCARAHGLQDTLGHLAVTWVTTKPADRGAEISVEAGSASNKEMPSADGAAHQQQPTYALAGADWISSAERSRIESNVRRRLSLPSTQPLFGEFTEFLRTLTRVAATLPESLSPQDRPHVQRLLQVLDQWILKL